MSGAVLGSRRIRCGWAQHKQETSSASYAAVDRVSCQLYLVLPSRNFLALNTNNTLLPSEPGDKIWGLTASKYEGRS